jgi:hypothetical protein
LCWHTVMNPLRRTTVWLGAVALLALAGCASTTNTGAGATTAPATASASPSVRPTTARPTTATPTPSPTPTPISPPPTKAADGTDPDACEDAKCEVKVKAGWAVALPRYRVDELTVESVSQNELNLTLALPEGQFDMFCDVDPECLTNIAGTYAVVVAHPGARVNINGITVDVVTVGGGSAIVRIKRR